jgi:hypothetical protein
MVYQIHDLSISVSSFATHPKNPFSIATSHFDNSVIFWDLLDVSDIF